MQSNNASHAAHRQRIGRTGLLLSVLAIAAVCFLYARLVTAVVNNSMQSTVDELAAHDSKSMSGYIQTMWQSLEQIRTRLMRSSGGTVPVLQARLMLEKNSGNFYHLYLMAEDGTLYTDSNTAINRQQFDMTPYLADGERAVASFTGAGLYPGDEELILYAVPLTGLAADDVQFTALVGISEVSQMYRQLSIRSFGGRGYSAIVDRAGNYLVNADGGGHGSLFDKLQAGDLHGESLDSVRAHLAGNETFRFTFKDADGEEKIVHFAPIGDAGLYFLLVVPQQVFWARSRTFVLLGLLTLAVTLLVVGLAVWGCYRMFRHSYRVEAESQARNEFLSNMSHEIRTPLNGLIGLNHLAQTHIDDRPRLQEYLEKSQDTANYLLALVNDVLDMAKLQAGKADIVNAPFYVETMLDAVCSMQHDTILQHGVELVVEKDLPCPCIEADEMRLKQVIMNIVGNAAKFTPAGGRITLRVTQRREGGDRVWTTVSCADTGIGMSQAFLAHIWDPFSQERASNPNSTKGTGLGMAISHLLVKAMGGEITATSTLGKGSTFTVTVPARIAQAPAPHADAAPTPSDTGVAPDGHAYQVLVAEDNALNAEILLEILAEEGFIAVHVTDGRQAVERFAESAPGAFDVILMDMQMPELDGCQAAAAIRALPRPDAATVPIFACTANTMQEDRDRAMDSGMTDFLAKPIDVAVLLQKLGQLSRPAAE